MAKQQKHTTYSGVNRNVVGTLDSAANSVPNTLTYPIITCMPTYPCIPGMYYAHHSDWAEGVSRH
jgi:hypothetical protein